MLTKNVTYRDPEAMVAIRIEGDFKQTLDVDGLERIVKRYHLWATADIRPAQAIGPGYLDVVNGAWETHQSVPPGFKGWLVVSFSDYLFYTDEEFAAEFVDFESGLDISRPL